MLPRQLILEAGSMSRRQRHDDMSAPGTMSRFPGFRCTLFHSNRQWPAIFQVIPGFDLVSLRGSAAITEEIQRRTCCRGLGGFLLNAHAEMVKGAVSFVLVRVPFLTSWPCVDLLDATVFF